MCSVICCFGCLTCCGCRDRVCQRLVFFPPKPFYAVEEKTNAQGGTQQTLWLVEDGVRIEPYTSSNMKLAFVSTRRKSTICTLWLRYPAATTTVLFSHGNATDIGCMRDHVIDYARQLKVNVMIYDYTGYGLSAGLPAMSDTLADAEAAYDYLLSTYPNESQRIIVYGQSLGSGPTMHLASKRRVSGVVIHAGIMSALRVIQPNIEATKWFDIYPNIDVVKKVNATLFVMHGTDDKEIPIEHGRALSAAAPKPFKPWFVDGAGHNNIEVDFREAYFARLDAFVRYIEETTPLIDGMEQTDDEKKALVKKRQGGIEVKNPRHPSVIAAAATGSSASSSPPPKESIALKSQPKSSTASSSSSASSSSQSSSDPRSPKKSPRGASQPTRFDHI